MMSLTGGSRWPGMVVGSGYVRCTGDQRCFVLPVKWTGPINLFIDSLPTWRA